MSNPTRPNNTNADDITVNANNRSTTQQYNDFANHSQNENLPPTTITMGISDSGATGHFLKNDAPVTNK